MIWRNRWWWKIISRWSKEIDGEKIVDIPSIPPLERDDEEEIDGKGLKILPPNKLLNLTSKQTILPVLLVPVKAENNSNKLRNKIRQTLYLLYQHNKKSKMI